MPNQPSECVIFRNYEQTCLFCGTRIISIDAGTMSKDHLAVLKESQWEIYRNFPIPDHILVPSTEIENKSFSTFPWLSSCYHRAGRLAFENM